MDPILADDIPRNPPGSQGGPSAISDAHHAPGTRTPEPDTRPRTALGSPCSPAWDAAHIALVDAAEAELGRRICGARTNSGNPCRLDPNHDNGRCRFHGGFNITGAQPGNRNAVVHGLYSRAIQTCGDHCPLWKTCPCAGPDIAKLPAADRPRCPYEVAAFNAAVTDARAGLAARAQSGKKSPRASIAEVTGGGAMLGNLLGAAQPMEQHAACDVAMMRVLVMRAAAALAMKPMVDVTVVTAEKYNMTTAKPSAYMQAFLRVSSEHRRYMKMYGLDEPAPMSDFTVFEQDRRAQSDTSLLPEDLTDLDPHEVPSQRRAMELLNLAERYASIGGHKRAKETFSRAQFLSPGLAALALDPSSELFLPKLEWVFPRTTAGNAARINDS